MRASRSFALAAVVLGVGFALRGAPAAETPADAPVVRVGKTHIDFSRGKTLVARYVTDPKAAKPYFWPLYALPGKAVTRAWPMEKGKGETTDHKHQKSAWFCHGDVIPLDLPYQKHHKGVEGIDFWSEDSGHGTIVCVAAGEPKADKSGITVVTRNEWRSAEGQKILDETRTIRFVSSAPGANLLVLDIDLHATTTGVRFGDTKEGSLGVRVRDSLREQSRKGGVLTNAEGRRGEGKTVRGKGTNADRKGCWGLVSAWCDYSGPVDETGTVAGVAVFADPANPIDTAWHARAYGLMAANPFGRSHAGFPDRQGKKDLVTLKKGDHLRLRYALFLHGGDAKKADVAGAFKQFASPAAAVRGKE
jgi:hypothetical protein